MNATPVVAAMDRLTRLEASLTPMFASMPKERDGTLSHSVVRYALQRFFAHQHGWSIRSFEIGNATSTPVADNSSNVGDADDWAPGYLQMLLEKLTSRPG